MVRPRFIASAALVSLLLSAGAADAQAPGGRSVTQGRAQTVVENLYRCPIEVPNTRISAVGTITSADGKTWTVPGDTMFGKGPAGADLYNPCNKVTPKNTAEVGDPNISIVEIHPDGEVITGYIVADNYFEFYVNGKLVAFDSLPYTPFNSVIVKFKVRRPITYAFKLVDWEENLGLGTEKFQGAEWHPGDGGLIARFSDGTVTDSTWKAQAFYIAPLASPDDVTEKGNVHFTAPKLGRMYPYAAKPTCQDKCYAVHYPLPKDFAAPTFDDSKWPRAYEFTDEEIGVTNLPAYTNFPELFEGARWIWSYNLVFDNVVVARKTVR